MYFLWNISIFYIEKFLNEFYIEQKMPKWDFSREFLQLYLFKFSVEIITLLIRNMYVLFPFV